MTTSTIFDSVYRESQFGPVTPARWKYLTNQYVEALVEWGELEVKIFQLPRDSGYVSMFDFGGILPPPGAQSAYAEGVVFEGHPYTCDSDGLCWTRLT